MANVVTPQQLKSEIQFSVDQHKKGKMLAPIFIGGKPGIGKSEIVAQVAAANDYHVVDTRLAYFSIGDWGIPAPINISVSKTKDTEEHTKTVPTSLRWMRPDFFPGVNDPTYNTPTIWFFDEFTQAKPAVMTQVFELFLNRRLGDYVIPESVILIAAGNRLQDKSIANRIPAALANRMDHFILEPTVEGWREWAINHNVNPLVVSYISNTGDRHLFNMDAYDTTADPEDAFPTPRSWHRVSEYLNSGGRSYPRIAASIGTDVGGSFFKFMKFENNIPDIHAIVHGIGSENYPETIDLGRAEIYHIVISAIISMLKSDDTDIEMKIVNVWNYVKRWNRIEFLNIILTDLRDSVGKQHLVVIEDEVAPIVRQMTKDRS